MSELYIRALCVGIGVMSSTLFCVLLDRIRRKRAKAALRTFSVSTRVTPDGQVHGHRIQVKDEMLQIIRDHTAALTVRCKDVRFVREIGQ